MGQKRCHDHCQSPATAVVVVVCAAAAQTGRVQTVPARRATVASAQVHWAAVVVLTQAKQGPGDAAVVGAAAACLLVADGQAAVVAISCWPDSL